MFNFQCTYGCLRPTVCNSVVLAPRVLSPSSDLTAPGTHGAHTYMDINTHTHKTEIYKIKDGFF